MFFKLFSQLYLILALHGKRTDIANKLDSICLTTGLLASSKMFSVCSLREKYNYAVKKK